MIGVGPQAHFQAAQLIESGYPYPLLLDPDYNLASAIGVGRQSLLRYLINLKAWLRWLWALITNRRQGRILGHYSNLPGTAVVDANGDVAWVYQGRSLGDHPRLRRVISEAEKLVRQ